MPCLVGALPLKFLLLVSCAREKRGNADMSLALAVSCPKNGGPSLESVDIQLLIGGDDTCDAFLKRS